MNAPDPGGRGGEPTWRLIDVVWLLMTVAAGLVGGGALVASLELDAPAESLASASVTAAVLGVAVGLLIWGRPERVAAAGLRPAPPREVLMAVAIAFPLLPALGGLSLVVRTALGQPPENPQIELLFPEGLSIAAGAVMVALVTFVVPFVEEMVFRGVLLDAVRERIGPVGAVLVTSGLFGLMHVEPSIVVATTLLGGVLGVLRLRSDSIWPSVALHAANNGLAVVAILVGEGMT